MVGNYINSVSFLILIYIKLLNSMDTHKHRNQEKLSIYKDIDKGTTVLDRSSLNWDLKGLIRKLKNNPLLKMYKADVNIVMQKIIG